MIYYLLYYGVESQKFTRNDLEQLLKQAATKNVTLDITGKLIYCEGTFIQLLEGHERAVRLVFQSILKDSRLIAVKKVTEGFAEKRYFANWSMAYGEVSLDEINEFEDCQYKDVAGYLKVAPALKLLKLLALKNQPVNF